MQRLLCSGRIRTIVTTDHPDDGPKAGERRYSWRKGVLDVGANKRPVSDKVFRALMVPDGGKTVMRNLVLLCRAHHHAVHAGELRIEALGEQRFRYLRADGTELPRHVDSRPLAGKQPLEAEHGRVAASAATTRWDGTRLDRHFAVDVPLTD